MAMNQKEKEQAKAVANARQHPEQELPANFFRDLMDDQLGRGYLNHLPPVESWEMEAPGVAGEYGWLRFARLPIQPGREEENTLLESWQSVLSACHSMNHQIAFVLLRFGGHAEVFLGCRARDGQVGRAADQLRQCMAIHMPGAEFNRPSYDEQPDTILRRYFNHSGVVTGIPSLRNERSGVTLQTLDKLARGIHMDGYEKSYALVVLADPAKDAEITRLQQTFLDLKSEIHQFASYSAQESFSENSGKNSGQSVGADVGALVNTVLTGLSAACYMTGNFAGGIGTDLVKGTIMPLLKMSYNYSRGRYGGYSTSSSVSREYQNAVAKYCEDLISRNISRLEKGRNLGFWQTGVYVMAEDSATTDSVLGILRSVYSGAESYVEPIRVINTGNSDAVKNYISRLLFLPLPGSAEEKKETGERLGLENGWHILGRMYESFSTAMTTEELSIASSLPRREVAGLRMVKNAVSFSKNTSVTEDSFVLGKMVDMGVPQQTEYHLSPDAFVRHGLVVGKTRSGKSTTCKKIIQGVREKQVPVLIIEPAKDDYVRWAIRQNQTLPQDQQYTIIMPGVSEIEGIEPEPLLLNLFQPVAWGQAPVHLIQHAESVVTLLNASLPNEDVVPLLIEEAFHDCLEAAAAKYHVDLTAVDHSPMPMYPTLFDLRKAAERVIDGKSYENRVKENFREVLNTRFKYLERGMRGNILNTPKSIPLEKLFERPVVINLSRLFSAKDKSLIMSLLLLAMQEYCTSRFEYDESYRKRAQRGELLHLLVIEEAHTVLTRPNSAFAGGDARYAAAELFENMLAEISGYGQGLLIVDQVPTKLIEGVIKNTNYKIVHKMDASDDIDTMATAMMLRTEQGRMISSLEVGNAIVCSDADEAAAWVRVDPN